MVKFHVEGRNGWESGSAETPEKAAEILRLLFTGRRAYVVNEDKTVFSCLNMTMDEAEIMNPHKPVATPHYKDNFVAATVATPLKTIGVLGNPNYKSLPVPAKVVKKTKPVKAKAKPVKKLKPLKPLKLKPLKLKPRKVKPLKVKAVAAEKEVVKRKVAAKKAAKKSVKKTNKKGKK